MDGPLGLRLQRVMKCLWRKADWYCCRSCWFSDAGGRRATNTLDMSLPEVPQAGKMGGAAQRVRRPPGPCIVRAFANSPATVGSRRNCLPNCTNSTGCDAKLLTEQLAAGLQVATAHTPSVVPRTSVVATLTTPQRAFTLMLRQSQHVEPCQSPSYSPSSQSTRTTG